LTVALRYWPVGGERLDGGPAFHDEMLERFRSREKIHGIIPPPGSESVYSPAQVNKNS